MKSIIVNFLVHVLSCLVPVEDHLNAVINKAASTHLAQEAEAALRSAERAADAAINAGLAKAQQIQDAARAEYAQRIQSAKALPPVVTPEGAAALVTASVAPATMPAALQGA